MRNGPGLCILDATDEVEHRTWVRVWERIGRGEIFSHPAYLRALAGDESHALAAHWRGPEGGEVLYAFIRRSITADARGAAVQPGLSDLITGLVYGGPLGSEITGADLDWFWDSFSVWARENGIVSEFIRFSPVAAERLGTYPGTLRRQAPHVVCDLEGFGPDDLVDAMDPSSRQKYRRALRTGYRIELDVTGERLEEFLDIYEENMDRVGAAPSFYFPREFFKTIHDTFPGRFAYLFVSDGVEAVSVALILYANEISYYFLSGCRDWALRTGAHVYVNIAAMEHSLARGIQHHVLTGGVTNTVEDSLLRFKRHLVPGGLRDYVTGEQIFRTEDYSRLLAGAVEVRPIEDEGAFFPRYRDPALRGGSVNGDD